MKRVKDSSSDQRVGKLTNIVTFCLKGQKPHDSYIATRESDIVFDYNLYSDDRRSQRITPDVLRLETRLCTPDVILECTVFLFSRNCRMFWQAYQKACHFKVLYLFIITVKNSLRWWWILEECFRKKGPELPCVSNNWKLWLNNMKTLGSIH